MLKQIWQKLKHRLQRLSTLRVKFQDQGFTPKPNLPNLKAPSSTVKPMQGKVGKVTYKQVIDSIPEPQLIQLAQIGKLHTLCIAVMLDVQRHNQTLKNLNG